MEVPEADAGAREAVEFEALADGSVRPDDPLAHALAGALDRSLARPYAARAVRRGGRQWAVAGRETRAETVALAPGLSAGSIEVGVSPDGERWALVDGTEVPETLEAFYEGAFRELEVRGRDRFETFVARADKVDDELWRLTIDPL